MEWVKVWIQYLWGWHQNISKEIWKIGFQLFSAFFVSSCMKALKDSIRTKFSLYKRNWTVLRELAHQCWTHLLKFVALTTKNYYIFNTEFQSVQGDCKRYAIECCNMSWQKQDFTVLNTHFIELLVNKTGST